MKRICPCCKNEKTVNNGLTRRGKQQFRCNNCGKNFSENTVKGCPHTRIPFLFIVKMLDIRKKDAAIKGKNMSMRRFRPYVNFWLWRLSIDGDINHYLKFDQWLDEGNGVSRQTINYWIKNFENYLNNNTIVQEASNFFKKKIREFSKPIDGMEKPPNIKYVKIIEKRSNKETLSLMLKYIGEKECKYLVRNHEDFFNELFENYSICEPGCLKLVYG